MHTETFYSVRQYGFRLAFLKTAGCTVTTERKGEAYLIHWTLTPAA